MESNILLQLGSMHIRHLQWELKGGPQKAYESNKISWLCVVCDKGGMGEDKQISKPREHLLNSALSRFTGRPTKYSEIRDACPRLTSSDINVN